MNTNYTSTIYNDVAFEESNTLSRNVIVNVDDLGISDYVNEAVVKLAQKRLITASSYIAGGKIDESTIKSIHAAYLDVGLHLDFTGLLTTAQSPSLSKLIQAGYFRSIDEATLKSSINQQLDIFEDTFNHYPRFIDGHQHIHQLPVISGCLIEVLVTRYGKDIGCFMAARSTDPLNYDLKSWIIYSLGGKQWKYDCHQNGIVTNNRFGGVYDFNANPEKLSKLWDSWLKHCPVGIGGLNKKTNLNPVSLIMCHPSVQSDNWHDDIKSARECEYQWMISGALKTLYEKHSVELTHWRDIYKKKTPK